MTKIFDGISDLLLIVDINENVIFYNKAFCVYSKNHYNIDKINNLSDIQPLILDRNHYVKALNGIDTYLQQVSWGKDIFMDIVCKPYYMDEKMSGVYFIFHNCTEFVKYRRNTHKDVEKVKNTFLASISHEIRTPLNGIIGMIKLLSTTHLNTEQKEYVDTLGKCGIQLLELINDILDFSKMYSGKLTLNLEPFNIRKCIEDSCDVISSKALEKNLKISYIINSDVPPFLIGDRKRVCQVLVNLLSNGIKFTEKGAVSINVSVEKDNGICILKFMIKDTGIGIDIKDKDLLFTYFTQLNNDSHLYSGTGLGLAISKMLVELMDGKIWFDSELGNGSTFYFTAKFKYPEMVENNNSFLEDKKIFILSDDPNDRRMICDLLLKWGGNPFLCNSIEEGKMYSERKHHFDLYIIDYKKREFANYIDKNCRLVYLYDLGHTPDKEHYSIYKPVKENKLFSICFDLFEKKKEKREKIEKKKEENKIKNLSIIVVEDTESSQKVIKSMLKRLGYTNITIVNGGYECIDKCKNNIYDLMLLDILMPGLNGYDVYKMLKGNKNLPKNVYAMTAMVGEDEKNRCINEYGMNGYIPKPVIYEELEEILNKIENL